MIAMLLGDVELELGESEVGSSADEAACGGPPAPDRSARANRTKRLWFVAVGMSDSHVTGERRQGEMTTLQASVRASEAEDLFVAMMMVVMIEGGAVNLVRAPPLLLHHFPIIN